MKIRTGFVSNSSSSSFIVAFPHKPKDVEDLKTMLFGKQEWHYTGSSYGDRETDVSTQKIAEKVFRKMGKKATIKKMTESIVHGWFDDFYMLPGHYSRDDDADFERIVWDDPKRMNKLEEKWAYEKKINDKRAKDIIDAFRRMNDDKFIAVMSFSDNDGEEVEEHSDIFHRVRSIRTSYH
jgi:hypothetical protein